jgi:hypothetical protein
MKVRSEVQKSELVKPKEPKATAKPKFLPQRAEETSE